MCACVRTVYGGLGKFNLKERHCDLPIWKTILIKPKNQIRQNKDLSVYFLATMYIPK